ncbi:MAG TPA: hypothetical protein VFG20_19760 [Planctomycetaceae bacterium]|jgi:hypothetical protein|nr:hypothetical protein [Planctomycetaceae bacterium]
METYVCRVDTPDGPTDYITLIAPEIVFSQGLTGEAIIGALLRPLEPGETITPDLFARNKMFVEFLHDVIARHAPMQRGCIEEASRLQEGWIYIIDRRTPTPDGAVPPEDILGAFQVSDGIVVPQSYQSNPNHQILSDKGFFQLNTGLQKCLLDELAKNSSS